jgi:hypothetical protein
MVRLAADEWACLAPVHVDEWRVLEAGCLRGSGRLARVLNHMAMRALHEGLAQGDAVRGWLG